MQQLPTYLPTVSTHGNGMHTARTRRRQDHEAAGVSKQTHCSILWRLLGMLQQRHAVVPEVPQKGRVVQPPLPGDGLRVAAELAVPEDVVCAAADGSGIGDTRAEQAAAPCEC